ncbi:MAG TPA: NADP-dependent oxidoreductase [Thermoplasmata archaeon]|nr:NADP-dependent oxidoreductase [Thermoplasmata archaeon]
MHAVAVRRFRQAPEMMELPSPSAAPGELLVRVEFAGVNPFDWKIADGLYEGKRPHIFPLVLGVDASGTVEAVGSGVDRFQPGDRVMGQFLHDPVGTGTYTERTVVPEGIGVARVPSGLSFPEAAALPTAGMTALAALEALALEPESTLVIVGASGGVGSFATGLAKVRGIRVVAIARAGSAARLRNLGAEEVVDPTAGDPIPVLSTRHPHGVDGLLDAMNDASGFGRFARLVHRGGRALSTTFSADEHVLEHTGVRGGNLDLHPNAALLERLAREVIERRLPVPVERQVGLGEAPAALAENKAGRGHGKTVVDVDR